MIRHYLPVIIRRGISFIDRVRWMTPLAGGPAVAVSILMRIRKDMDAVQSVFYDGKPVRFRGFDEQVLREVLVDREYDFLTDLLSATPVPTILDVGAHIGTFAIWVFSVNTNARVVSVGADPKTHRVADLNAAAFTEGGSDWQVIHGAASGEDGAILHLLDAGPSMSHRIDKNGTIEVHSISLTRLLDRIAPDSGSVDLVKIDVEGSEEAFLCDAPEALKRVKSLVIELHPQLCDTKRVQLLIEKYFSRIKYIGGRKSVKPLMYCWHNAAAQRKRVKMG